MDTSQKISLPLIHLLIEGKFRNFEHYKYFAEFLDFYEYILPKERVILPSLVSEFALATPLKNVEKVLFLWMMVIGSCISKENQLELIEILRKERKNEPSS